MEKKFRLCAGAVVFNKEGKVWLGDRIDTISDDWQFPQGGIETGETPAAAAQRELFEETGITSVECICTDTVPSRYEFTKEIKNNFRKRGIFNDGQDIYFSLFYFYGNENEINVCREPQEFKKYMWGDLDFAVQNVIGFKTAVYAAMAERFAPIIEQYISKHS